MPLKNAKEKSSRYAITSIVRRCSHYDIPTDNYWLATTVNINVHNLIQMS